MHETQTTKASDGELSAASERLGNQKRNPAYEAALGARIRAARVAAKVSQTTLSAALGVTFQQVQKYESGRDRVAVSTLHSIATALGVHPGWFFDESMPVPVGPVPDVKRALKSADVLGQIRDPRVLNQLLSLAKVLTEGPEPVTNFEQSTVTGEEP